MEEKKPQMVQLYHCTDDIMLTSDSLADLEGAAPRLLQHLQEKGWAVNSTKVQGPGLSVKFFRVIWSGKTKIIPEAVLDSLGFLYAYHCGSITRVLGRLDYWRVFILHLAQILRPLY